jgi:hypothetical protein
MWLKMKSGKAMPCNTEECLYKEDKGGNAKIVTQSGRLITGVLVADRDEADGIGYVSHYATCPGADYFRRR